MFSIDLEVGMRDQSKLLEEIRVFGFSNDIKLIRARISKERTGDILNVEYSLNVVTLHYQHRRIPRP